MSNFQRLTLALTLAAPLALGACTSGSRSGTVSPVEPSAASAGVPTATDLPPLFGTPTAGGDTFVLPPEPGFNPDGIVEAP
jgi:hypothetical protein